MNKFVREMEARSARSKMISEAMREYEAALTSEYGSPYAFMAGFLESTLTSLAADRLDSTEELVRALRYATARSIKETA
jgi:hypothetical protein